LKPCGVWLRAQSAGHRARMTEKINLVFMIIIFYRLDDGEIQKDCKSGPGSLWFYNKLNFTEYVIYEI